MGTTFSELKRQVLLRIRDMDGVTDLAISDGINQAHKAIARVYDYDELIVLDTANAVTMANQSSYHLISNLALSNPKDIYSIRLMDGSKSRKLTYVPPRELDSIVPYKELSGTGRSCWYTQRGMYIELFRIPDSNYALHITHSKWPATLSNDSDETPYLNLDDIIVTLGTEIAISIISRSGVVNDWTGRAKELLGLAVLENRTRPDVTFVACPFNPKASRLTGEYWLDPFQKGDR
jgi:hypothetical protein